MEAEEKNMHRYSSLITTPWDCSEFQEPDLDSLGIVSKWCAYCGEHTLHEYLDLEDAIVMVCQGQDHDVVQA